MNAIEAAVNGSRTSRHQVIKALVLDDDVFQRELISDVLRGMGVVDITSASSGEDALKTLSAYKSAFNLLLLDLHMPGMDGFQFMGEAARLGFRGSLIIISGQSADVMKSASLIAQLRQFPLLGALTKPVSKSALSELLAKLR